MGMILVPPRKKLKPVEKLFAVDREQLQRKPFDSCGADCRVDDPCDIGPPAGKSIGRKAPHHHS
jgi:hypothetical protein